MENKPIDIQKKDKESNLVIYNYPSQANKIPSRDSNKQHKSINTDNKLSIYLKEISKIKPLSKEAEEGLIEKIHQGNQDALDTLVQANLKFVVAVCRNYQNQGMPFFDLISEGNLGLIKAAKRFDANKNCKFISYAVWWIRQSILQAMAEQSRTIKLPINKIGSLHNIKKACFRLEQKLGRSPTIDEISEESAIDLEEVKKCMEINHKHIPLDNPIQGEDNVKLSDVLPDHSNRGAEENMWLDDLSQEVGDILGSLPSRESEVLRLYFGIDQDVEYTLEEIGERFDLTRERVRQIKEKALTRLKHVSRLKRLEEYKV